MHQLHQHRNQDWTALLKMPTCRGWCRPKRDWWWPRRSCATWCAGKQLSVRRTSASLMQCWPWQCLLLCLMSRPWPWPQLAPGSCPQACLRPCSGHGSRCSATYHRQDPQSLLQILVLWCPGSLLHPLSTIWPGSIQPLSGMPVVGLAPHMDPADPSPVEEEGEWVKQGGQCLPWSLGQPPDC